MSIASMITLESSRIKKISFRFAILESEKRHEESQWNPSDIQQLDYMKIFLYQVVYIKLKTMLNDIQGNCMTIHW